MPTTIQHYEVANITNPTKRPHVLMVVANPGVSTTLGWPVGFWAAELFHPFHEFTQHRYDWCKPLMLESGWLVMQRLGGSDRGVLGSVSGARDSCVHGSYCTMIRSTNTSLDGVLSGRSIDI